MYMYICICISILIHGLQYSENAALFLAGYVAFIPRLISRSAIKGLKRSANLATLGNYHLTDYKPRVHDVTRISSTKFYLRYFSDAKKT